MAEFSFPLLNALLFLAVTSVVIADRRRAQMVRRFRGHPSLRVGAK